MNRAALYIHIETQLAPTLQHDDVMIADNLSSRKSVKAQEFLKAQGGWLLFLPPDSPDLSLSKNRIPSSTGISDGSRPALSTRCSNPSPTTANSFQQTSAKLFSKLRDILQIKGRIL